MRHLQMNDETRTEIINHARAQFPRECCGLVIVNKGKEMYVPCRNISDNPANFTMCPEDYARAEEAGDILSVVHSHCNVGPQPSMADLSACEASGLPWVILSLPTGTWGECSPSGFKAPLIGRPYVHGIHDCYTLIVDWYREEPGITIPEFERPENWWKKGLNLYMENFEVAGFRRLSNEPFEKGDVIIMQLRSPVPNHAAIYLGDDLMLHHLENRLSCRDVFGGYWRKNNVATVRYIGT